MDPSVELGPFHTPKREAAVCVRRAFKQYGLKNNRIIVLDGLNMTVDKGTIYGLLGASGCGKTTLLTCIVGRRKVNAGVVWVLGGHPGEDNSGVPGPRVGYMPQEISLLKEFTITETLKYFGWLCGLKTSYIMQRKDELTKFLELPTSNTKVGDLSGGQQRRVSFAVALLHDPELLILDEPTVGVDPVLRQSIWDYLLRITSQSQKSVIITTHYIEEARQAQKIGLMREGVLLAEDTPKALLERFHCESLEEVFLKLSIRQQRTQDKTEIVTLENKQSDFHEVNDNNEDLPNVQSDSSSLYEYNCENYEDSNAKPSFRHHLKALIWKNILWIRRNVPIILFLFVLPMVQVILFCTAIGRDPKNLHLAVVNHELRGHQSCDTFMPPDGVCNMSLLSCQYLNDLANRTTYQQDSFSTLDDARTAVRRGLAWGVIYFNENYTESLVQRIDLGGQAPEDVVETADITVNLDMSNQAIGHLLTRDIAFTFMHFIKKVLRQCQWNPQAVDIPMRFNKPVYASAEPRFLDFTSPGSMLAMVFILAVALTGGSILTEKSEGVVERCLVAGVTMQEVLLSHIIVEIAIMAGQCAMCLFFAFVVFDIVNTGPWSLVIILSMLQGVNGMCLGFLLSSVFDSQVMATLMGVGYFLAILFISGIVWPVEGMHWTLQYAVHFSPLSTASESMRSIMLRGWGITEPVVYYGFIMTIVWIGIYLSLTMLSLRLKKALH